jgi:hypothetical protein
MDALLAAIMLWLSTNIQPSSNLDYLRIEFAPSSKIVALRYLASTRTRGRNKSASLPCSKSILRAF